MQGLNARREHGSRGSAPKEEIAEAFRPTLGEEGKHKGCNECSDHEARTQDGKRLSLIALKQFCAGQLPLYMIPDTFSFLDVLPKTSTDKIDYQALQGRG